MNMKKIIPSGSAVLMALGVLAGAKLSGRLMARFMPVASPELSAFKLPVRSSAFDDLVVVQ